MKSTEDIEILGMGTQVIRNSKGVIIDQALFSNALANCLKKLKRLDQLIEDVFINVLVKFP